MTHPGFMRSRAVSLLVVVQLSVQACSVRSLPPPRAPERVVPTATNESPPLHEGEGQLTLDAVDGPAHADLVTGRTAVLNYAQSWGVRHRGSTPVLATQLSTRPLCVTPCTVNLPLGPHEISFTSVDEASPRSGTAYINVGSHPSIVRHAMGFQETHVGGIVGALLLVGFGISGIAAGGALMGIHAADSAHANDLGVVGGATLGIGGALTLGGILLGLYSRPESQPGTTVQWTP